MLYVDDLLFVGETQAINNIFNKKQEKMLLRATGEASPGNTISSLGRKITNKGDHFDISLDDEYVDNIFHEMKLNKCNPAATTGTTSGKSNVEDEQLLDQQEHQQFRRLVGKLHWLAKTRPDISYATSRKHARAIQQPTIKDQKKMRQVSCRYKRLQIQQQTSSQAV